MEKKRRDEVYSLNAKRIECCSGGRRGGGRSSAFARGEKNKVVLGNVGRVGGKKEKKQVWVLPKSVARGKGRRSAHLSLDRQEEE